MMSLYFDANKSFIYISQKGFQKAFNSEQKKVTFQFSNGHIRAHVLDLGRKEAPGQKRKSTTLSLESECFKSDAGMIKEWP